MSRSNNGGDEKVLVLSPTELQRYFKFKKFPKGLVQVGAAVVEKLDKSKVGQDFGIVNNPYGDAWEVTWDDGETELIRNPTKNLALSLQIEQEIMINNLLHRCSKYDKGCHVIPVVSSSGSSAVSSDVAVSDVSTAVQPPSPSKRPRSDQQTNQAANQSKKKSKKATTKKSKKATTTVTNKWKRCRAKKLTNAQRSILTGQYDDGKHSEVMIMFAERSLQEYMELQKSPLHLNYKNVFTAAIRQVMCQVVPDTDKPLGGDVDKVCNLLLPICQKAGFAYFYRC